MSERSADAFTGSSRLAVLLRFSSGPAAAEIADCIAGALRSHWIVRAFGHIGLSWIGSVFVQRCVLSGLAQLLQVAASTALSYSLGSGRACSAPSAAFDLLRAGAVLSLHVPALIAAVTLALSAAVGVGGASLAHGVVYIAPLCFGFACTACASLSRGALQGVGRAGLSGAARVCSAALSAGALAPLLLLRARAGVWGASLAAVLADGAVGAAALCVVCARWRRRRVRWRGPLSAGAAAGLSAGLPSLAARVCAAVPCVFVQRYLARSSQRAGTHSAVMGAWSAVCVVFEIVTSGVNAAVHGLLPTGAFAFGRGNGRDLLFLAAHALWISLAWSSGVCALFLALPGLAHRVWAGDAEFERILREMMRPSLYTGCLCSVRAVVCALLQIVKQGKYAVLINAVSQLVGLPLFSTMLYLGDRDSPCRIMWCYAFCDVLAAVLALGLAIIPLRMIRKMIRENSVLN